MAEYFVSFRVAEEWTFASANDRRKSIYDAIEPAQPVWDETTSFIILRVENTLSDLMKALVAGLDPNHDMMVIRQVGYKNTGYWGAVAKEELLVDMVPEARRIKG